MCVNWLFQSPQRLQCNVRAHKGVIVVLNNQYNILFRWPVCRSRSAQSSPLRAGPDRPNKRWHPNLPGHLRKTRRGCSLKESEDVLEALVISGETVVLRCSETDCEEGHTIGMTLTPPLKKTVARFVSGAIPVVSTH